MTRSSCTDGQGRVQRINAAAEPLFGPRAEGSGPIDRGGHTTIRGSRWRSSTCWNRAAARARRARLRSTLVVDGVGRAFRQRTTPMRDTEDPGRGGLLLEDITHLREIGSAEIGVRRRSVTRAPNAADQPRDGCASAARGIGGRAFTRGSWTPRRCAATMRCGWTRS